MWYEKSRWVVECIGEMSLGPDWVSGAEVAFSKLAGQVSLAFRLHFRGIAEVRAGGRVPLRPGLTTAGCPLLC